MLKQSILISEDPSRSFPLSFVHHVNGSQQDQGRYNGPVPTSNLVYEADDFPEFEPFEGVTPSEATPRGPPGYGALSVLGVDMCLQINKSNHFTSEYDTQRLVVRRGQEFVLRVSFSRPLLDTDDFQLEFLIGANPSPDKESFLVVTFGGRRGSRWAGRVLEAQGAALLLGVTPTADAIVGKFRTYVAVVTPNGLQRTMRDANTDFYLLFNAWCPEDAAFYPDEVGRREYVLNDYGVIFQGTVGAVSQRNWMFGQFERGILDACIYILDSCRMPIFNRGNLTKLVRMGSAMLNSQDDNGVLVGNWSEDYSGGTAPTMWTGSVTILLQYANSGVPVCFAQCWVFAGVFNTFLRCLGVPARVVTNFSSAHDNTGNLKTDLIFKPDGTPDKVNTRDSIWNYHCWNEVFMSRRDLPAVLGGWQVVDATPQETSDGHFRCGPASVAAIKQGLVNFPFDAGFVFAECNSDVCFLKRDRYGGMELFRVDKTHVGQAVYTQAIGSYAPQNITANYKNPEGSSEDEKAMAQAEELGCHRDHSDIPEGKMLMTLTAENVLVGQDVVLVVDFQNQNQAQASVMAHMSSAVVFYTGVMSAVLKEEDFSVSVAAYQTERVVLKVAAQDYMSVLGSQRCLSFMVSGECGTQSLSAMATVLLQVPSISLMVSGRAEVGQEMFVTASFTNSFSLSLLQVSLAMEGPGLLSYRTRFYQVIEPQATITWTESFFPRLVGRRRIAVVMGCRSAPEMWGLADIDIIGG